MGKGSKTETTTQQVEPWGAAVPYLQDVLGQASQLYGGGQLAQLAGLTPDQLAAFEGIRNLAGQPGILDTAQGTLASLMDPTQYAAGLEGVTQEALATAIPAATAQFAGAGLTDSTAAQQEVARAATQAVAPYQYGAYQTAQDRALQAAGLAPQFQAAQYLPYQMLGSVGAQQQAQQQAALDLPYQSLQRYAGLAYPAAGFGGTTTGTTTQTAAPGFFDIFGAGLQALPFLGALSDRRLKRDIQPFGTTDKGYPLYEFKYLWDDEVHVGVMADEVPHAIVGHIGPYAVIDYGKVL